MFSFKSAAHLFASIFSAVVKAIPAIQKTEVTVEAVTAAVPVYGAIALPLEKMGFAVLGEIASILAASGAAGHQKLADAGLDIAVIDAVKALVAQYPGVVALVAGLKK